MKKVRKDLIKRLHDGAWSGIKKEIEKEFPKLFKEDALVVGKWYKYPEFENWKLLITDNTKGKEKGVGFNCSEIWMKDWLTNGGDELSSLIPCSDKEVEEALIKEAKKRGFFNIGNIFKSCFDDNNEVRDISKYDSSTDIDYYYVVRDGLRSNGLNTFSKFCSNPLIYQFGKWATIVETITKEQAEKELGKTILN